MRHVLILGDAIGAGCTFGGLLSASASDAETSVVPTTIRDVPLFSWLPGTTDPQDPCSHPYEEALWRAKAAQNDGEIVAVLWKPSESDASSCVPDCESLLRQIIANFRRDLGLAETVPFVMCTPKAADDADAPLEAAMETVSATTPYVGLVNASDLAGQGAKLNRAESERTLGERCFRMWKSMTSVSPEKLAAQAEKYRDAPRVRTNILLDPGEFLVTSSFGRRAHPVTGEGDSFHAGIDGALWNGRMLLETGICAWRDGNVAEAADTDGPAGTCVAIDHGEGLVSRYLHLERGSLKVATSDCVRAGELIGWMGKTGRATGEHLHFQIEKNGEPLDPLPLLTSSDGQVVEWSSGRVVGSSNDQTDKRSNGQTIKRTAGGALP